MNKNLQNGFILGAALQGKTEAFEPQGEIEIIENGEYNVAEYASANVNVASYPINVTFMNGDEEYAKVGIDGEGKIAEPTVPNIPEGYKTFDGWYNGTSKITFPYQPNADKTLSAVFASAGGSLADDSWSDIVYVANNKLANTYTIGDTKPLDFTINGVSYSTEMQLVGKLHDRLIKTAAFIGDGTTTTFTLIDKPVFADISKITVNGVATSAYSYSSTDGMLVFTNAPDNNSLIIAEYISNEKAELTFIIKDAFITKKVHEIDTNSTGWGGCTSREYCETTVFNSLPLSLRNGIKTVAKRYTKGQSASLLISADKIWLPCWEELGGTTPQSSYVEGQGTAYSDVFTDNTSRIKKFNGVNNVYWVRSESIRAQWSWFYIDADGSLKDANTPKHDNGIVFGFCL